MDTNLKMPTLGASFIPIIVLMALLALNVLYFGADSSYGPNQIALLAAAGVAGIIGLRFGRNYEHFYTGIIDGIQSAMGAVIILLLIGSLAGTWLISGVVPAMIYYGLEILNPSIFLAASCVICAIVSLATGSSWSTIATVGIALIAIGQILGIDIGWSAGAIISGAYFGDKMSPLSDTTNLAPAIAGTDLFTHIKHMLWTTVPSISIALIVFLIVGFVQGGEGDADKVLALQGIISEKFNINGWLFLVPIGVISLIIKKVPTIPALFIGAILGGVFAIIFQPDVIDSIAGETANYASASYKAILHAMALDTTDFFAAENARINDLFEVDEANRSNLLKAGGMVGMLNTVWLIICALTFGGAMQAGGFLKRITRAILSAVNSTGSLIASTAGASVFFNLTASDQYIAIVVPGKMFKDAYKERGLAPENLSRVLEDSGTVTSVLIPWNTCGVAQSGVLGVATGTYWIYCIFNLISPLMTIAYGIFDIKIKKLKEAKRS
jgi:NhaC family Na+:H+ antiporter